MQHLFYDSKKRLFLYKKVNFLGEQILAPSKSMALTIIKHIS